MINLNSVKNKKDYIFQYPNIGGEITLELGKNNFNGTIENFIIIKNIFLNTLKNIFTFFMTILSNFKWTK